MRNNYEDQLDTIRVDLYERTRDLTNADTARVTNENAKKIAEQYGIEITSNSMSFADKNVSNL